MVRIIPYPIKRPLAQSIDRQESESSLADADGFGQLPTGIVARANSHLQRVDSWRCCLALCRCFGGAQPTRAPVPAGPRARRRIPDSGSARGSPPRFRDRGRVLRGRGERAGSVPCSLSGGAGQDRAGRSEASPPSTWRGGCRRPSRTSGVRYPRRSMTSLGTVPGVGRAVSPRRRGLRVVAAEGRWLRVGRGGAR